MNGRGLSLAIVLLAAVARLGATDTVVKAKEQPVVRPSATPVKKTLTVAQLRALIKDPGLTGGSATTRSPKGAVSLNAIHDLVKQEDAAAMATRTTAPGAGRVPIPPAGSVASLKPGISQNASQLIDGIHTVNGKNTGFLVSPGSNVTIKGHGFGTVEGRADVAIKFLDGRTSTSLRVARWTDDEIWALLPAGLSGAEDQAAGIHVVTRLAHEFGKASEYHLNNGRFVAERAEATVVPREGWTLGDRWVNTTFDGTTWARWEDGESITCKPAGADVLTVSSLQRSGFVVVALMAQWGPTDSGDKDARGYAGSRTYSPGYNFGEWNGDSIPIHWGVWRSHTSPANSVGAPADAPAIFSPYAGVYSSSLSYDICRSQYAVKAIVSGPRGVPPPS